VSRPRMTGRQRERPFRPEGPASEKAILDHVLAIIGFLRGREVGPAAADEGIAADLGIAGMDSFELVYQLEEDYGVDLHPFLDARTEWRKGWFRRYPVTADATPREFAQEIARQLSAGS
jgi:hypothetical protein